MRKNMNKNDAEIDEIDHRRDLLETYGQDAYDAAIACFDAADVCRALETCYEGVYLTIAEYAQEHLKDTGALVDIGDLADFFDYYAYAEYLVQSRQIRVVETPTGVHVFRLLPPT